MTGIEKLAKEDVLTFNTEKFGRLEVIMAYPKPWFFADKVASTLGYGDVDVEGTLPLFVDKDDMMTVEYGGRECLIVSAMGLIPLIENCVYPDAYEYGECISHDVLPLFFGIKEHTMKHINEEVEFSGEISSEIFAGTVAAIQTKLGVPDEKMKSMLNEIFDVISGDYDDELSSFFGDDIDDDDLSSSGGDSLKDDDETHGAEIVPFNVPDFGDVPREMDEDFIVDDDDPFEGLYDKTWFRQMMGLEPYGDRTDEDLKPKPKKTSFLWMNDNDDSEK